MYATLDELRDAILAELDGIPATIRKGCESDNEGDIFGTPFRLSGEQEAMVDGATDAAARASDAVLLAFANTAGMVGFMRLKAMLQDAEARVQDGLNKTSGDALAADDGAKMVEKVTMMAGAQLAFAEIAAAVAAERNA